MSGVSYQSIFMFMKGHSMTSITSLFNNSFKTALSSGVSDFTFTSRQALDYILETYADAQFTICESRTKGLMSASIDVTTNSGDAFIVYLVGMTNNVRVVKTANGSTFH